MSRTIRLLLIIAAVGILVAVYFIVKNRPADIEEESTAPEFTSIDVTDIERDEVKQIELIHEGGRLVVEKQVIKAQEEDEDDETVWRPVYDFDIPLNEGNISRLLYAASGLSAKRIIEEGPDDLSVYGLDDPQAEVRVDLEDGSVIRYFLGNASPTGDSYYLMKEGDENVYAVRNYPAEAFLFTLDDLRSDTLPTVNLQNLTYLRIENEETIEIELVDPESDEFVHSFSSYKMTQPYSIPRAGSSDKIGEYLENFPRLYIGKVITDQADDLSVYGLDPPRAQLEIRDANGGKLHLLFGTEADEGGVYAKQADEDKIFTITEDLGFLDQKAFDFVDKFILLINIDLVESFTIKTPNKTYTSTIERETVEKEGEEEDEVIATYFLNGVEIAEKPYKKFYQKVIGLLVDSENPDPKEGKAEVTISFDLNKEGAKMPYAELVPLNKNFYSVYQDGISEFVLSKVQVDAMTAKSEEVLANPQGSEEE